jgi:hypoxanthine phosphoribosyltransferase
MFESHNHTPQIMFSSAQIHKRVVELAEIISADYQDKTIDVICLINSASIFCADLVRYLVPPVRLHHMSFVNYSQIASGGEVRITHDIAEPLHGREVLVVEGIVVSGRTPKYVLDVLGQRKPASVTMCALGRKPSQLVNDLPLKYVAFDLGEEVAVGYGVGSTEQKSTPYIWNSKV